MLGQQINISRCIKKINCGNDIRKSNTNVNIIEESSFRNVNNNK